MKKIVTIAGICALVGALVFASLAAAQPEDDALEELLALEREALDLWYGESDPTVYAQQFAGEATYYDPWSGGILEDEGVKEYLMSFLGQVPKLEYEISKPRVDVHGSTAVFTFEENAIDPQTGKVLTHWNATTVYTRTKDGWEKVHANWSYRDSE